MGPQRSKIKKKERNFLFIDRVLKLILYDDFHRLKKWLADKKQQKSYRKRLTNYLPFLSKTFLKFPISSSSQSVIGNDKSIISHFLIVKHSAFINLADSAAVG